MGLTLLCPQRQLRSLGRDSHSVATRWLPSDQSFNHGLPMSWVLRGTQDTHGPRGLRLSGVTHHGARAGFTCLPGLELVTGRLMVGKRSLAGSSAQGTPSHPPLSLAS